MSVTDPATKTKTLPPRLAMLNPVVVDDLARYGTWGDGGYVLPSLVVRNVDALLSFGIFFDWTLEEAVSAAHPSGLLVHAYDHTISGPKLRKRIAIELAKNVLRKPGRGVGFAARTYAGYKRFFTGERRHFEQRIVSTKETAQDATIDDVFARAPGKSHVFVKMDIEGSEYHVIPDLLRHAGSIDLLAIEFHETDRQRETFVRQTEQLLGPFEIVHIHGNNFGIVADDGFPESVEVTLVNRRLVNSQAPRRDRLPLPGLDAPNDPSKLDYPLIFR